MSNWRISMNTTGGDVFACYEQVQNERRLAKAKVTTTYSVKKTNKTVETRNHLKNGAVSEKHYE